VRCGPPPSKKEAECPAYQNISPRAKYVPLEDR